MTWVLEGPLSRVDALVPTLAWWKTTCADDTIVLLVYKGKMVSSTIESAMLFSLRQTLRCSVINFWFLNNWRTLARMTYFKTKGRCKRYSCEDQAKKSQISLTAGTSYISMHSLGAAEKKVTGCTVTRTVL